MSIKKISDSVGAVNYNGTDLIIGTSHGEVFLLSTEDLQNKIRIFADKQERDVVDICSKRTTSELDVALVVKGVVNDPEGGEIESTEAYLVSNGNISPMGIHVSKLLSTQCAMQLENQLFSVYYPQKSELIPWYSLELFMGTEVYDFDGDHCMAINRSMTSSTIYTIDLVSKKSRQEYDTFSFDGPYLSQLNQTEAMFDDNAGGIITGSFDDLDEADLKQEEQFNAMIDPSLVLQVHHPRTYIDFVRIIKRPNAESIVISGGRDSKVILSTLFSHDVLAEIICDDTPRCGAYDGTRYFYFGCDDGQVGIIDLQSQTFACRFVEVGEEQIRKLRLSLDGHKLVALNVDNVLFNLDCRNLSILEVEQYEEWIIDFYPIDKNRIIVCSESGSLYCQY